jgi:hypothetical protein
MSKTRLAWILALLLSADVALGQVSLDNILPFKDMVFPQVAAGGAYQSWITVTNRGTETWNGEMRFRSGAGVLWNPVVNGTPVGDGTLTVSVDPGATVTYKVTLPGSTEAGYAIVTTQDANLTNSLEGHLTYYVSEGDLVTDSVGVPPARQFLASSLPFEDFNSICLALANTDLKKRSAHLKMRVLSDANAQVGQTNNSTLVSGEHTARYLWQLFPGTTLGRGRLEIESDVPISGIALTQAPGNQLSSLPLESTTRTYSVEMTSGTTDEARHMVLWTESFFVKGYFEWKETGASEWARHAVFGQIAADGRLHLHLDSDDPSGIDRQWFWYIKSDRTFTPGLQTWTGTMYAAAPWINYIWKDVTFTATPVP